MERHTAHGANGGPEAERTSRTQKHERSRTGLGGGSHYEQKRRPSFPDVQITELYRPGGKQDGRTVLKKSMERTSPDQVRPAGSADGHHGTE